MISSQSDRTELTVAPKRRNRITTIAILLVVFTAGLAAGSGIMATYVMSRLQFVAREPLAAETGLDRWLQGLERKVAAQFNLSGEEREVLSQIFREAAGKARVLRQSNRAHARALSAETLAKIRAVIPPARHEDFEREAERTLAPWGLWPRPQQPAKPD
jgi:uncharacterized membrane protein